MEICNAPRCVKTNDFRGDSNIFEIPKAVCCNWATRQELHGTPTERRLDRPPLSTPSAGANLWKDSPSYRFINIAKVYRQYEYWILFLSPETVNHFGQKCSGQNIGGKWICWRLSSFHHGFHSTSINLSRDSRDLWIRISWIQVQGLGVFLWFGICPEYRPEQFQFITGGDLATWLSEGVQLGHNDRLKIWPSKGLLEFRCMLTTCLFRWFCQMRCVQSTQQ